MKGYEFVKVTGDFKITNKNRVFIIISILVILYIINICVLLPKVGNESQKKYKMLTEMDESKEFMKIKFIQIDENFE